MKTKSKKSQRKLIAGVLIVVVVVLGAIFFKNSHQETHENHEGHDMSGHEHGHTEINKTPEHLLAKRDVLLKMLDPKDPNTIFKIVDALQADRELVNVCHEVAHDIGHKAFEYYGFSDAMTFDNPEHVRHALVQNICAGGYMHGILEQMSLADPEFLKHPESVCDLVPTQDRASCFHGMGHVYMVEHTYNAPASILGCRVIKDPSDMYRCFEGVRMEQFWGGYNSTSTTELGWDPQDPLGTCVSAQTDEKPTCFLYSTFGFLRIHPREYTHAAELCATKEGLTETDRHFCLKGLGMTMMSKFKGEGLEGAEEYTQTLTLTQKRSFYEGMVNYSMLSGKTMIDLRGTCELLKNDSLVCLDALSEQEGK